MTIDFDPGIAEVTPITLASQLSINIPGSLTIDGGSSQRIISGNGTVRVFAITGGNVTFRQLKIRDGSGGIDGGGIKITNATVTLETGCEVTENAANYGAGIRQWGGTLTLKAGSSVTNNTAGVNGGGITTNDGSTILEAGSLISGNTATEYGGGVDISAWFVNASLVINGATITGNTADFDSNSIGTGGGLYNADNVGPPTATVTGNTANITGNTDNSGTCDNYWNADTSTCP